uniref:Leucine rich repeat containing 9 n=1 Tax=Oryzias latipes TaxID=8090 RepID=A0A3P9HJB9_ORYLA
MAPSCGSSAYKQSLKGFGVPPWQPNTRAWIRALPIDIAMLKNDKKTNCRDEEVVKKLCLVNGVSYEKIAQEGSNVTSLEIFFSGFPRMVGLSFFPRLCQLTIVDQTIEHIEGLENCPLLQQIWIVQCRLREISGLQNCQKLEKLYLYNNQICEIQNLDLQVNLEVLWLNNNCITTIQGLDMLQNLKELNLADNLIEKIGNSLDPNVSLEILNLSGNQISSFKELAQLAHMPRLKELALKDPMSTPNPVCLLCNYATHVLYHIPGLQQLDSYNVSDKQVKEAAEAAVMKKMMYYNMRVRSAKRNLSEKQLSLTEKKKTLLQLPEECIRTLSYALKKLECELSTVPVGFKTPGCMWSDDPGGQIYLDDSLQTRSDSNTNPGVNLDLAAVHQIHVKIETLRERLTFWTKRINDIEAWCKREKTRAAKKTEHVVQFLYMELESVGNIRLEAGCPTDLWFNSCCNLLVSRFAPSEYKTLDVIDIKVDRAFRIHNSALRHRFVEKLHSLMGNEDAAAFLQHHRRRLEYLFYIADPEKCEKEETFRILQEGFTTTQQKSTEREAAGPLSNSLAVAEQPRIEFLLQQDRQGDLRQRTEAIRHGQVIVSKVFIGNSMPFRDGDLGDISRYPKVYSVYRNLDVKSKPSATHDDPPSSGKKNTGTEMNPPRRQWFVFQHELVLPEYIIYFEYILEDKDQSTINTSTDNDPSNEILDKAALNMEPVLKLKPELLSLNNKILLNVANASALSQIIVLNLHGNSLSEIKEISRLTALRHLTISFNKLTHLDDISYMPSLEFLDASFNHLVTLDGLQGLKHLEHLDVCWNKLSKAREITSVLRKHTPALLKLDTRYNPWSRPEVVRSTLLGHLTTLTHLDGVLVSKEEAAEAEQVAAASKINQASLLAHSSFSSDYPRRLSLLSTVQLLYQCSPAPWGPSREMEPDWTLKITSLNLDDQRISKLNSLSKLENLRWASLDDNNISRVDGIDCCLKLEELSLNNNCIATLKGLGKLRHLKKLSVDGNQLSGLEASVLKQLPDLIFLSVENNSIMTLDGIQNVQSLLELYIGKNRISSSRDVHYLKRLANLIILDLCGNALAEKLESYRIFVIFHLTSLKALDGVAVDASECESAKSMFKGRLTTDMVVEKLGHSNYTEILYLTLHSCSIRMVDLSPAELFCNLCSINLDHNNLTSFSGLIHLPNLKALSLNYNHIESILPKHKIPAPLTNRQILHSRVHSSGYGQQSPGKTNRDTGPTGSLEPLMGGLEVLHLSHNGISNMANLQLSRLTNLKSLFLQGNDISQVEGLEGLQQLRELVLDRNRIKALARNSFTAQSELLELHLEYNRIRELNHLDPLVGLQKLFLCMNKLQDVAELEKLEVLQSLTELSVIGNPVAQNSLHRPAVLLHLSSLQLLDGVMVTLEERTRAELLKADPAQCSQVVGASFPTTEFNLPGLPPLLAYNTTIKGISINGRSQNLMHGHETLTGKKHKHGNAGRSSQTDYNIRHSRRMGSNPPASRVLLEGNRTANSKKEQDTRCSFDDKPQHM